MGVVSAVLAIVAGSSFVITGFQVLAEGCAAVSFDRTGGGRVGLFNITCLDASEASASALPGSLVGTGLMVAGILLITAFYWLPRILWLTSSQRRAIRSANRVIGSGHELSGPQKTPLTGEYVTRFRGLQRDAVKEVNSSAKRAGQPVGAITWTADQAAAMHRECFLNSAQTLQYRYPKTYDEMVRAIVTPEVEWQLLARAAQLTDLTHEQVWGALIGGVRRADRARENGPFTPLELMARSTSRISAENPPSPYLVA